MGCFEIEAILAYMNVKHDFPDSCQLTTSIGSHQRRQGPEAEIKDPGVFLLCSKCCEFNCLSIWVSLALPKPPQPP